MRSILFVTGTIALGLMILIGDAWSGDRSDDELGVAVSPQTLILGSVQGGWVTVHTEIPAQLIVRSSLSLNGVAVSRTGVDACGDIVGYFDESAIKALVQPPSATMTLMGMWLTGEGFTGSDTVRVINK